jgi:23S rRNA (adenine2503-C2)-methyltransferase
VNPTPDHPAPDRRRNAPGLPTIDPLGRTRAAFIARAVELGWGTGKAEQAYVRAVRDGVFEGPAAAAAGRSWVAPIVRRLDEDGPEGVTTKFVQRLDGREEATLAEPASPRAADRVPLGVLQHDGRVEHLDIESVVIPMIGRTRTRTHTLCVSSQVGCAMGCRFCETAQMGLIRSLTPAEIVGQWWAATHIEKKTIDNIVFMGMGEPLDNLDAVLAAIEALTDHRGAALPMSNITISTVGRVDGLRRLAEVVARPGWKRLGLALSVNAPNDAVRNELMPVNRRWDMAELRAVMEHLCEVRGRRKLMFEYVVIPGVNDSDEHAADLAEWLRPFARGGDAPDGTGTQSHIGLLNVIPYNPRRDSPWPAPSEEGVKRFVDAVAARGIFVKRRRTKGRSQMAACGQLGTAEIRGRRFVPAPGEDTPG